MLLIIIVAVATGGGKNTTPGDSSGSSRSQHSKVGDQVSVANTYVVTVNSVTTSNGDQYFQPKAGNTYLIVDVTVKNISSQQQDLSSLLQFSLKDSTGQKYHKRSRDWLSILAKF